MRKQGSCKHVEVQFTFRNHSSTNIFRLQICNRSGIADQKLKMTPLNKIRKYICEEVSKCQSDYFDRYLPAVLRIREKFIEELRQKNNT
jgi:hypothetical protein